MPDTFDYTAVRTKFCKYCGTKIPEDAVICTACGRQVEELKTNYNASQQPIIINNLNTNTNVNTNNNMGANRPYNKWVAVLLCFFFGVIGVHKFYEGKIGMGVLYIFTVGLFGIGWLVDLIVLLTKPNPYYLYR